jgi:F-type H+-transporting ATPase subunit delta
MRDRKLASRYARALLDSLSNKEVAESVDHFLTSLGEALEESREFRDLLYNPAVPKTTRETVLRTLAEQAGMVVQVANFLSTVVDHNRITSLPSIAKVFHEEREAAAGIVSAEITTARPLADDLKRRTLETLEQITGRKVRLQAQVDPSLLGGAVTMVGSTLYDGSIRTQLAQLRRKMTQE